MSNRSELKTIRDLAPAEAGLRTEVAELLVAGFADHWPNAYPRLQVAIEEVDESLHEGRISRVAINHEGHVIGWISGIRQYGGHTWELHPLVVHPSHRGMGVGTALVKDFEEQVREAGAMTIWLGTDDEAAMTSLGAEDLYPNVLGKLAAIRSIRGHPFEFYQKLGYSLVGVIPDANGLGKPDIIMAKRVGA